MCRFLRVWPWLLFALPLHQYVCTSVTQDSASLTTERYERGEFIPVSGQLYKHWTTNRLIALLRELQSLSKLVFQGKQQEPDTSQDRVQCPWIVWGLQDNGKDHTNVQIIGLLLRVFPLICIILITQEDNAATYTFIFGVMHIRIWWGLLRKVTGNTCPLQNPSIWHSFDTRE